MLKPMPVSSEALAKVEGALSGVQAGGMTALCGGLELGRTASA